MNLKTRRLFYLCYVLSSTAAVNKCNHTRNLNSVILKVVKFRSERKTILKNLERNINWKLSSSYIHTCVFNGLKSIAHVIEICSLFKHIGNIWPIFERPIKTLGMIFSLWPVFYIYIYTHILVQFQLIK